MAAEDESRTDRRRAAVFLVIVSVALLLVAIIRFTSGGNESGNTAALSTVELTSSGSERGSGYESSPGDPATVRH